jgi:uncharacterized membrane-anchored protein
MSDLDLSRPGSKVARVTFAFWVMKICATTLGETGGDLLAMTLNIGYALSSLILISIFLVTLAFQLRAKSFHPGLYWLVIVSTSTAGTTMSDYMDRTLHLGYVAGSLVLVSILALVLAAWRLTVGSLSVENIRGLRTEAFYWTAILVSNTLGTALGDFLSDTSGLGFGGGAFLIASVILAIALAYLYTPISRTLLFWAAFVLTRPLGATFGDLLTKMPDKGGLGFGTIGSSIVLALILVGCLSLSWRKHAGRSSLFV